MNIDTICHELWDELKSNEIVVAIGIKNSSTLIVYTTELPDNIKNIIPSFYKGFFVEIEITTEFKLH